MQLQQDRRKPFSTQIATGLYPVGLIGAYVLAETGSAATTDNTIKFFDALSRQYIKFSYNGDPLVLQTVANAGGQVVYNTLGSTWNIKNATRAYDPKTWVIFGSVPAGASGTLLWKNDDNAVNAGWMHSISASSGVDFCIEYSGTNLHVQAAPAGHGAWADTIHCFAFTWDGTTTASIQHLYIDGIEQTHSSNTNGSGTHATDGSHLLTVTGSSAGAGFGGVQSIVESFFLFNRILSPAEIQELYLYPYRYFTSGVDRMLTQAIAAPSQDYIFYDSFPYASTQQFLAQQARHSRNQVTDVPFASLTPPPVVLSMDWLFYDAAPYAQWEQQRRQQAFERSKVVDALQAATVPTGPAPSCDYVFYDSMDYRAAKRKTLLFPRDWIADASWFAALPTPAVPHSDFMFYDSHDYRAIRTRIQQTAYQRNQTLNVFQANFAPSFDWHFNDSYPYDRGLRAKLNFQRNYDADAGIIFAATGPAAAPSIGYQFEDTFNYRWPKLRALRFPRDYIADASFAFQIPVVVPSQGYIFYDPVDYRFLRLYPAIARSRVSDVFEAPYGWFIPPPFVPPSSWYPVVSPLSIPVHQRESQVVIGLPNDIRDGTRLPMWDFLPPGEPNRTAHMVKPQVRFRQWEQQEPPVQPPKTPISVFFFATMEPFAGALTKQYTRKFNAVMQPFQGMLSILTPQPAGIVGFATAVCTDIRNFFVQKFTSATICEDPRTLNVPVNTQVICQTFIKDPTATLDYSIDWTQPLVNAGDQINTSAWAVDVGLTVVSSTYVGNVATAFIAGGTNGTSYSVTNTITTVGGRTLAANFILSVQFR